MNQTTSSDAVLARSCKNCTEMIDCVQPTVRGDWFLYQFSTNQFKDDSVLERASDKLRKQSSEIAETYEKQSLSLTVITAELCVADTDHVEAAIRRNPSFRQRFPLAPLLDGGTISRKVWEEAPALTSAFQELNRELGMGTPIAIR